MTCCASCTHLYIVSPKDAWYRWLCKAAPLPQWENPVTGLVVADPPYALCRRINLGSCPMHEPGPNTLHPREMQHGNAET